MTTIAFNPKNGTWSYDSKTKTFMVSEKEIPFATSYLVQNTSTGNFMEFEFTHSTGSEFDPTTRWVYKSKKMDLTLEVCNDAKMCKQAASNYLAAKTGRS
ncbi:MAG: hypothetical protein H7X88_01770 [Gloeobacteraceae cyanobacterium ES-bin-316]|nr:hypothetical protein [Ferruginibacter sp.]